MLFNRRPTRLRRVVHDASLLPVIGAPMGKLALDGGAMSLLVLAMGGSKFEVGLLFTAVFASNAMRVIVGPMVDVSDRRRVLQIGWLGSALLASGMLVAIPLNTAMGWDAGVWLVVAAFFLARLSLTVAASAWQPLLSDIIPSRLRGRFFGRMRTGLWTVGTIVTVLAGWYLGGDPSPERFYPVIGVCIILGTVRALFVYRLPAPPPARTGPAERPWHSFGRAFGDPLFRRLLLFQLSFALVNGTARPFAIPFLKSDLGFPSSVTLYLVAGMGVGAALMQMRWGRVVDRWGNRFTYLAAIMMTALAYLVLAIVPHYDAGPVRGMIAGFIAFALLGAAISGVAMAMTVRLFDVCPDAHRGAYMACFHTAIGLSNGVLSLSAGLLLDALPQWVRIYDIPVQTMRIHYCIVVGMMLLVATALRALPRVREPRMREVFDSLIDALPGPLAMPLVPLNAYLRRSARRPDISPTARRGADGQPARRL